MRQTHHTLRVLVLATLVASAACDAAAVGPDPLDSETKTLLAPPPAGDLQTIWDRFDPASTGDNDVVRLDDGSYVVGGATPVVGGGANAADGYVRKYDKDGTLLWATRLDGSTYPYERVAVLRRSGNVIYASMFTSNDHAMGLAKLDATTGAPLWNPAVMIYPSLGAGFMQELLVAGNFAFLVHTNGTRRIDLNTGLQTHLLAGGTGGTVANGNVYVLGSRPKGGVYEIVLSLYPQAGPVPVVGILNINDAEPKSIAVGSDNTVYLQTAGGLVAVNPDFQTAPWPPCAVPQGAIFSGLSLDPNGNLVILLETNDTGTHDISLMRVSRVTGLPFGDIVTFDDERHGNNYPWSMAVGPAGDVIVAGTTEDFVGNEVYYSFTTLWFGTDGKLDAAKLEPIDDLPSETHRGQALVLSPSGDVVVVGRSESASGYSGRVVKYALDFDGDGLWDSWERDGLTVDGYTLDLKKDFGVHIDHKDLLLEVDMMNSVSMPIDGALQDVQLAFSVVPNALARNPDGRDGIDLHLLVEPDAQGHYSRSNLWLNEDTVPATIFANEPDILARYGPLREAYFGTVAERGMPTWTKRKKARELVTRYMLVADHRNDNPGRTGQSEISLVHGSALGGNDALVYGECLTFTLINNATPALTERERQDALAGTIMHELGHLIGLQHGSYECVNYKPQYHSVMNYSYQVPIADPAGGGTYAYPWTLDYSSYDTQVISEGFLLESQGLRGNPAAPAIGSKIGPMNASFTGLDQGAIDFDRDGVIDPDGSPINRDLNHFYIGSCGGEGPQSYRGANDWTRLVYLRNDTAQWQDHTLGDGDGNGASVEPEYDDNVKARLSGKCNHLPIGDECTCTVPSSKACGSSLGTCVPGTQTCNQGIWTVCTGGVPPRFEECDGTDDDCDGTTDEDFPTKGQACTVGTGGCARPGTLVCKPDGSGVVCNATAGSPGTETCNGIDDDCDGAVDEGNPGGGASCDGTDGDLCNEGTLTCSNGALSCTDATGTNQEICNDLDDDCDGLVDEAFPTKGQPCNVGQGACLRTGQLICLSSFELVCSVQSALPTPEVCDGIDNNCNGTIDDGNPGGGVACDGPDGDLCKEGVTGCSNGAIVCSDSTSTSIETCNGLDDDCDGLVDEGNPGGGVACDGADGDLCAEGVTVCTNGAITCNDNTATNLEICNGLDDDCDGAVDEGNPGGGVACDGPDGDLCAEGTTVCTNGTITCNDATGTNVELCNGQDDNCNGTIDEGNPGGDVACDGPDADLCKEGVTACAGGVLTCSDSTANNVETCNGVDDDCDGIVDEGNPGGGGACDGSDGDSCLEGTLSCQGGALVCSDTTSTTVEACNNVDDDCDGVTDEGNPGGGAACTTGQLGVCSAGTQTCNAGSLACARNVGPSSEICGNGIDEDCNGTADDGCIPEPAAIVPWNGKNTGSVKNISAQSALRPIFRWWGVSTATSYQIQIDDSCTTESFTLCGFPSPEVSTTVTTTTFRPATALAVSTTAPVGRRYFWRVRACASAGCSFWSTVRYVNVGRLGDDFNGDGFSDLIVGAPMVTDPSTYEGMAFVYNGSASGLGTGVARTIANPLNQSFGMFASSVAAIGDVNGDGFADAAIGAKDQNTTQPRNGIVYVFNGTSFGLPATADRVINDPVVQGYASFGASVDGAGDVNADGYADLVVGAPGNGSSGNAYIFKGLYSGVVATPWATLEQAIVQAGGSMGTAVAGGVDFNADGFSDVVVGDPGADYGATNEGAAYVYAGSATTMDSPQVIEGTTNQASSAFGSTLAVADVNGDGYGDVIGAAQLHDSTGASDAGAAWVFLGGMWGLSTSASRMIASPVAQAAAHFGSFLAAGDFNRDGFDDIAFGSADLDSGGLTDRGAVWVWPGSASGLATFSLQELLGAAAYAGFGTAVCFGDMNGDGFSDLGVGARYQSAPEISEGNAFIYAGGASGVAAAPTVSLDNPRDEPYAGFGGSLD